MMSTSTVSPKKLSALLAGFADIDTGMDCDVQGISVDSRRTKQGDLFLACAGTQSHGLNYADSALGKGAVAIAYEPVDNAPTNYPAPVEQDQVVPVISVEDLGQCIGVIAERFYGYPSYDMFVIGITGTNGKTSCSHFLAQALTDDKTACGVIGTLGNGLYGHLDVTGNTTPDAVTLHELMAEMRANNVHAVVIEVSSHGLVQGRVNGIDFNVAIFTNLSRDHFDYHLSMEAYGEAKRQLFNMPGLMYAVINTDDEFGRSLLGSMSKDVQVVTYGIDPEVQIEDLPVLENFPVMLGDVRATHLTLKTNGIDVTISSPWGDGVITSPLIGRFNASNLLAVSAVMFLMGYRMDDVTRKLGQVHTIAGRMERFEGRPGQAVVIVDYAHTPDALRHVLKALREQCQGKLWCVFGCGGDRDQGKRPLMASAVEQYADQIVITDDNPRHEDGDVIIEDILSGLKNADSVHVERNREQAIAYVIDQADGNDLILVSGKGHEDYQLIGDNKIPFSDREIVQSLLREKAG